METAKRRKSSVPSKFTSCSICKECSTWTHYHFSTFVITFFSYALFHVTRKTFSNVKSTISQVWQPMNVSLGDIYDYQQWNSHHLFENNSKAEVFLGTLDTLFMFSYSLGLFISGAVGDRLDLRKVLAFGMCSSSITAFLFGAVSEWTETYSCYWYVIFWTLTGLLQSTGWPTVVAIVGNWFGKSSRGLIMGIWGASPSVGNIIGSYIAASVIHYGYEFAFVVPSAMTFAGGIIVFFSIIPNPRDVGLPDPDDDLDDSSDREPLLKDCISDNENIESNETTLVRPKAIGFKQAFLIPGVAAYSLAYACLKLVNYSFFFWLPYYLHSKYCWSEADSDSISVWYDVGGIFGSIIGGYVSDRIGTRSPIVGLLLLLSPGSLFIYSVSSDDKLINAVLMSIVGFFIGGAANLISTAIAADLGREKELSGNKEALSTVTGIIDGTGSAGAAIGQVFVPIIEKKYSWECVFYLFMVMTLLTLVCIIRVIYHDLRDFIRKRRQQTMNIVINADDSTTDIS